MRYPRSKKVYEGRRDCTVTVNGKPLNPRLDLADLARGRGFAWGYGGAGASQLALAILCDYLGDVQAAWEYFQDFKWLMLADRPAGQPWKYAAPCLEKALRMIRKSRTAHIERFRGESKNERRAA
jgi:hypothetical protein